MTTVVSTKGQVILPKAVRQHRNWPPGTKLVVEETLDGVLLRPETPIARTRPADVFACLKVAGPARSVEEMDAAVANEIRRRHAGD